MAGFFVKFNNTVIEKLEDLTKPFQTQFAHDMQTLAGASITLYILWVGYQVLAGKRQTPIPDLVWDLSKFAILLIFITNADGYLTTTIEAIKGIKAGFAGSQSVWTTLDSMWLTTQKLATQIMTLDNSKYVKIEGGIGAVLVWGGSILIMAFAAIIYMIADVTMQLMLMFAPVAIFCLMWGFFRTVFNNWLNLLLASVFTVLFASVLVRIGTAFQTDMFTQITTAAPNSNLMTMGAMAFVIGIIIGALIYKSSGFAQQLAGAGVEGTLQGMATMGLGVAGFAAGKLGMSAGRAGVGLGMGLAGKQGMQSFSGRAGNLVGRGARSAGRGAFSAAEWAGEKGFQSLAPTGALGAKARRLATLDKVRNKSI